MARVLDVPHGCINANALRSLATALDRLNAFHTSRGGPSHDSPCLKAVGVGSDDKVFARVLVGDAVVFRLELINGAWEFM